jgi:hypothetical protein
MRAWLTVIGLGSFVCGLALAACGGTNAAIGGSDAGADGTASSTDGGGDAGSSNDAAGDASDAGSTTEAGLACAPPSNPGQSALCLLIVPESMTFTSDPKFDGKGWLVAQLFTTAQPNLPDGGSAPVLAMQELPPGGPDAGSIDLSQPLPVLRFDGLPSTVYVRVVFVDDPAANPQVGASTWLGGFDLSAGLLSSTPLVAHPLPVGEGTALSIDLVALREMIVTMNRSVAPAGNGEGPATAVATPDQSPTSASPLFGEATNACARVDGTNTAVVPGFVIGKGPYYVAGVVDDFGLDDGGLSLPPGALTSLEVDGGGFVLPAANLLTYDPKAYRVSQTITLNYVLPGAPAADTVSCP